MTNLWVQYGLESDPYFVNPLASRKDVKFPISLFVGREKETKEVLNWIASSDNSRIVIEGEAGVGKTTYIQNIKYIAGTKNNYLTYDDQIRIVRDYNSTQFVIDIIQIIIYGLYHNHKERIKEFEKDENIVNAKELVETTKKNQWGIGGSILGVGGSVAKTENRVLPMYQSHQFYSFLEELATSVNNFGFNGIIIHIDNMENLCSESPDVARRFFNDVRDFLLLPNYHFILGARVGFSDEILGKDDRVRDIFTTPKKLKPLNLVEIHKLLKKRYEHLKINKKDFTSPVEDIVIDKYHTLFRGDLRSMFSIICEAISITGEQIQPKPLHYDLINKILQQKYLQFLKSRLLNSKWEILEILKDESPPFRQTDLEEKTELSQGRISQIFAELERSKAVICTGTKGKSKWYDLSGISKIAFGKTEEISS